MCSTTPATSTTLARQVDDVWVELERLRTDARREVTVTPRRYSRRDARARSRLRSAPAGDQPEAIEALAAGVERGDKFQTLLGITGSGKSFTTAGVIAEGQPADARARTQQEPRRAAHQRVPRALPEEPGRVLRLLLRLLPARGVPPDHRHLHREGLVDQRRDRPAPALGHQRAHVAGATWSIVASVSAIYGLGAPGGVRASSR